VSKRKIYKGKAINIIKNVLTKNRNDNDVFGNLHMAYSSEIGYGVVWLEVPSRLAKMVVIEISDSLEKSIANGKTVPKTFIIIQDSLIECQGQLMKDRRRLLTCLKQISDADSDDAKNNEGVTPNKGYGEHQLKL
jgi:hypothetical protein